MDRKLLTNFSLVFILETYNRLVGYLLILVALKYTGSEGLGIYSFVNTLVSLLITFSGLGINLLLTREFARDGRNFNRMYLNVTILKLITGTIVYIIFYLIGSQHFDPVVWEILKVVWIVTIIETIAGTSFSIFYGTETVQYIVYISLIMKTIILATAPYVLSHSGDIKLFIYTFFTLRTLQNIIITLASFRVYGLPEPKVSIRDIGGLLKATLPFALNTNVSYIFVQTDILMLGFLTTYSDVGVYRFGFMFVEASLLISNVIVKVSYPRLSKVLYNQEDGWNFVKTLVSKTLGIATAITISLITLADYVIPFFFENIPEGAVS